MRGRPRRSGVAHYLALGSLRTSFYERRHQCRDIGRDSEAEARVFHYSDFYHRGCVARILCRTHTAIHVRRFVGASQDGDESAGFPDGSFDGADIERTPARLLLWTLFSWSYLFSDGRRYQFRGTVFAGISVVSERGWREGFGRSSEAVGGRSRLKTFVQVILTLPNPQRMELTRARCNPRSPGRADAAFPFIASHTV